MRRPRLAAAAVAAVAGVAVACVLAAAAAVPALAQDDGHGHGTADEISLSDLPPEQRAAALDAWAHVYCACPSENWSRTLSNCPDGCSGPQRRQILRRVGEGWTLDRIVEEQVKQHGAKAAADPGARSNGTLLVLAGLVAGVGIAAEVLRRWRAGAAERAAKTAVERSERPVAAAECEAVERELGEID